MGFITDDFFEAVNEASKTPVPVLNENMEDIPASASSDESGGDKLEMASTVFKEKPLDAIEAAEKAASAEAKMAESVSATGDGEEQYLNFNTQDIKLPYYFKSFDELAQVVLSNVFQTEGLKSINANHFGEFLKNTNPRGFTRAFFGKHEFFIQNNSDRMIYVFEFLANAKTDLLSKRRFECDLVREVDVNNGTAYTLVLTPKELMDIQKSYPDYKISYIASDDIRELKLIIKV